MQVKLIENWDDFKEFIFRMSNIGFYVRWTASEYTDGKKGIYLIDFTIGIESISEDTKSLLEDFGVHGISGYKLPNGFMIHGISPKIHD